jgi:hypothetical protein
MGEVALVETKREGEVKKQKTNNLEGRSRESVGALGAREKQGQHTGVFTWTRKEHGKEEKRESPPAEV